MALTEQEKERITEEEKLRQEIRQQHHKGCGGSSRCGRFGRWCCGIKLVVVVLILAAIFWHRPWHCNYNDRPIVSNPTSAAEMAPKK